MSDVSGRITYIDDGDGEDSKEPALLLIARKRRRAFAIGLSVAWKYCNANGYATLWAWRKTEEIADFLGLGTTHSARRQVWVVIMTGIQDLLRAPEWDMVKDSLHSKELPALGEVQFFCFGEPIGGAILH